MDVMTVLRTRWASEAMAERKVMPRCGTSITTSLVPSSNIWIVNAVPTGAYSDVRGQRATTTAEFELGAG